MWLRCILATTLTTIGVSSLSLSLSYNDSFQRGFTYWPYGIAIYKDRGHPYKMYGRDDNVYGECIVFPGDDFACQHPFFDARGVVRKLRYLTSVTADQIKAA
jgi:hypothetical protein